MDRVERTDNGQHGRFTLYRGGREIGLLEYIWDNEETIRATHTFIPGEYRGQNLGQQLFDALMEFVSEHSLTLIPECPYIAKKINEAKRENSES